MSAAALAESDASNALSISAAMPFNPYDSPVRTENKTALPSTFVNVVPLANFALNVGDVMVL